MNNDRISTQSHFAMFGALTEKGRQGPLTWEGDPERAWNSKQDQEQKPPKPSRNDKLPMAALEHKRLSEPEKSTTDSDSEGSEGQNSDAISVASTAKGKGRKPRNKQKFGE